MTMQDFETLFKEQQPKPEDADALAELEQQVNLKPTGVQMSKNSTPVTIYHTVTHEPRTMPYLYAQAALLKRFRAKDGPGLAGKRVFSSTQLGEYVRGNVKCLLHPYRPERAEYDKMGMPTCLSAHLPSEYEAERHMENKHHSAWERIEKMKERKEEEEEKKRQAEIQLNQVKILQEIAKQGRKERKAKKVKSA